MHEHRIAGFRAKFSVLVCSSTRDPSTDEAGSRILSILREKGHEITHYGVVKDDPDAIRKNVLEFLEDSDAVILSGGTGITRHDVTVDTVSSIAEFEMAGFGHVFSLLSYNEIGTGAVMSRATAFVVKRKPVFCLPGSPAGAELGVKGIILEQIDHIQHELGR